MKTDKMVNIIFTAIMILSLVWVGGAAAKSENKVEICHTKGNGSFELININADALQAHLEHGDVAPGGTVPGQSGLVLAADCSVTSTGQNTPAQNAPDQTAPLPLPTIKGKKASKVDVCHRTGNGTFILININRNALPAHLAHGDGLLNGEVPEQPGRYLTNTCSISDVPRRKLVDTLIVPATDKIVVTSVKLKSGQAYEFEASGQYIYRWPNLDDLADPEYYWEETAYIKGDDSLIYEPWVLDLIINDNLKTTDWGEYNASHIYTIPWTGDGGSVSFYIYDTIYYDNRGSLTVKIWKINW